MRIKVYICINHTGLIDKEVELSNIRSFCSHELKNYIITLGMDDQGIIYSTHDYHAHGRVATKNDPQRVRFFHLKDIKIQLSNDLYKVFERALICYKTDIRDSKLMEIGII